jgi:transposase InsO family protein
MFMTRQARATPTSGTSRFTPSRRSCVDELDQLTKSVDHIKEIVATQQIYAGASSILEPVQIAGLIEDALRMQLGTLTRHQINVIKNYGDIPVLSLDKHRLLLILVNLISNAGQALSQVAQRGPRNDSQRAITKLRGPGKWTYFHLYVILDIFSRYVVGWMIAPRETAELAEMLIADTVAGQNIEPGCLTLHADRGTSMRSKTVAALLVDLEVIKTHSRPYVSNDNPFSESHFKTFKYRPDFPDRFGCIDPGRRLRGPPRAFQACRAATT